MSKFTSFVSKSYSLQNSGTGHGRRGLLKVIFVLHCEFEASQGYRRHSLKTKTKAKQNKTHSSICNNSIKLRLLLPSDPGATFSSGLYEHPCTLSCPWASYSTWVRIPYSLNKKRQAIQPSDLPTSPWALSSRIDLFLSGFACTSSSWSGSLLSVPVMPSWAHSHVLKSFDNY